jgi:dTDP-4-amino-4,6-dideoxygalactose transaminase
MCLSFQFKKHLPIGRGGMILLDNIDQYNRLQRLSYDGRDRKLSWPKDTIYEAGYHYYMTPEDAARGIDLFFQLKDQPRLPASITHPQSYKDYNNLTLHPYFQNKQ